MTEIRLAAVEARFADIVWRNEPLQSRELAEMCQQELSWKRTTTYTVLKRLCERGLFQNNGGTVSSLIARDEYYGEHGKKMVDEAFDGSLPAFIAAFSKRKALTPEEAAEIRRMIDSFEEAK